MMPWWGPYLIALGPDVIFIVLLAVAIRKGWIKGPPPPPMT